MAKSSTVAHQEKGRAFFRKVLHLMKSVSQAIWKVLVFFGHVIVKLLTGIYFLIKSVAFGISALIASIALLIMALSLSVYLLSSALGLTESESLKSWREELVQMHHDEFEHRQEEHLKRRLSTPEFTVEELLELSCSADTDCATPNEYLIQSRCPFTSKCLQDRCAVVCPKALQ